MTHTEFQIRPVLAEDVSAIREIYAESVRNGVASYELTPPNLEEIRLRFQTGCSDGYPWLAAIRGGNLAGYAYASAFRTRPAYRWLVEDSIYLSPDMRGHGIGSALLVRLIEECATLGFRQMVAVIGGAHPASVALHRKAGFVTSGRILASGFKFGRWLDTEFMQLALGEGNVSTPDEENYPGTLFKS